MTTKIEFFRDTEFYKDEECFHILQAEVKALRELVQMQQATIESLESELSAAQSRLAFTETRMIKLEGTA